MLTDFILIQSENALFPIFEYITPKFNGNDYTHKIVQITRYSYDSATGNVTFIINRGKKTNGNTVTLTYGLAKLNKQTKELTVSNNPKDTFKVEYTFAGNTYNGENNHHYQDICYSKTYGLLIPIWYNNAAPIRTAENNQNINNNCYNRILIADISASLNNSNENKPAVKPKKIVIVNGKSDTYSKYELESLSIVTKDKDKKKLSKPMIVFSANAKDSKSDCDRLGMITNSSSILS